MWTTRHQVLAEFYKAGVGGKRLKRALKAVMELANQPALRDATVERELRLRHDDDE